MAIDKHEDSDEKHGRQHNDTISPSKGTEFSLPTTANMRRHDSPDARRHSTLSGIDDKERRVLNQYNVANFMLRADVGGGPWIWWPELELRSMNGKWFC